MTKNILNFILLAILVWPGLSLANGVDGRHMMDGWGMNMMGGWGVLALLTWVVWLIVGVLVVIWLVKQITKDK